MQVYDPAMILEVLFPWIIAVFVLIAVCGVIAGGLEWPPDSRRR